MAGGPLGGSVDYWKPTLEAVTFVPHTRRTALGLRAEVGYVRPFGVTIALPYYERFFLGGETQIRGVNVRTVSPVDRPERALGGNKFLLFNAEYYFDIAGPCVSCSSTTRARPTRRDSRSTGRRCAARPARSCGS